MRLRPIAFSLVVALVSSTANVWAAGPEAGAASKAEARDLDASAAKLAKSGAFREAIAALKRSQELVPRGATLKRIAELERELKDFAGAYTTYGEVLAKFVAEMKPAELKDIDKARSELAAITGSIHLKVADAGAKVDIDGAPVGEGPLDKSVRVNLGPHVVHANKADFAPFEGKVDVPAPAEVELVVALAHKTATLVVRVKKGSFHVKLDGEDVGATPFESEIPAGPHTVQIGQGDFVERRKFDLPAGGRMDIDLEGQAEAKAVIRSEPEGAEITIDGSPKGKTPWEGPLPAGQHEVVATLEGFEAKTEVVDSNGSEGKTTTLTLVAKVKPARFDGFYGQFNGAFVGSPSSSNFLTDQCGSFPASCTSSTPSLGGEFPFRIGYSLGWLGIEAFGIPRFDATGQSFDLGGPSADFLIYRITLANGLGVRFMPATQKARFAAGLGLAWAHEIIGVTAQHHNAKLGPLPSASGDAPMLTFDIGVLIGDTPGAKLRLALEAQIEFDGSGYTDSAFPSQTLARGTQLFIGPAIGAQFGH